MESSPSPYYNGSIIKESNNYTLITNTSLVFTGDHTCNIFLFTLYGVICGLICLLGFTGNSFSIFVLLKDQSSPVASFLLQALAVADNCFLILWMIHYSVRQYVKFIMQTNSNILTVIRMYTFPILYMAQMQTIWLTVVIALNRFMAVCMPYRAPQLCTIYNVYKNVIIVTAFSIIYNIPKYFERQILNVNGTTVWEYTNFGKNSTYKKVYNDGMYYLFTFILPLLILAYVNTKVIFAFQAVRKRKERMTTRRQENDHNITLVMIMVVVVFMICQGPARVVQMVYAYGYSNCKESAFYMIHISNTFEVLNSSLNFLIYIIFRKRFRDILLDNFCCGPIVTMRQGSVKSTTTEGMALTERGKTTHSSFKQGAKLNNDCEKPNAALVTTHSLQNGAGNSTHDTIVTELETQDHYLLTN